MSNRDLYIEEMEKILSRPNEGWVRAGELKERIHAKYRSHNPASIGAIFRAVCDEYPKKFVCYAGTKQQVFYGWKKNVKGKKLPEVSKSKNKNAHKPAKTKTVPEEILEQMREILPRYPEGVRYADLRSMIHKQLPNRSGSVIGSRLKSVADEHPREISRKRIKGKGVWYFWAGSSVLAQNSQADADFPARTRHEEDFYESFARLLERRSNKDAGDKTEYLEECSKAIIWGNKRAEGGNRKWANPDVIGIFKPVARTAIKFPDEVVSAEIKVNSAELLIGFGQCCAYQLFSHKVYLVVPKEKSENFRRLKTMCHLMGIGLVVFNPSDEPAPSIFTVILRARKQEPDAYFLNESIPENIIKKLYPEW